MARSSAPTRGVRVLLAPPLVAAGPTDRCPSHGLVITATRRLLLPRVNVVQDGRVLAERRLLVCLPPWRRIRLSRSFFAAVDPRGGHVCVGLADDSHVPCGIGRGGPYLGLSGP